MLDRSPRNLRNPIDQRSMHRKHYRSQWAYSILELMIALGLLAVLMLLGWGMMATLQRSQERSWKLTQRVRVIRLTRAWLNEDCDHLARAPIVSGNINGLNSTSVGISEGFSESFSGDVSGFYATIVPSVDPVPFLRRLGDQTSANNEREYSMESLSASPEEIAMQEWKESLWGGERIEVEYRLEPILKDSAQAVNTLEPEKIQYELVRREWIPDSYFDTYRAGNMPVLGMQTPKAARKGSTNELSRSNGTGVDSMDDTEWIPPLKETKLYGMVKPKFRYFDGSDWLESWSSMGGAGLPKAIAITFDFPPISEFKKPEKLSADEEMDRQASDEFFENPLLTAQADLASMDSARSGLEGSGASDRLVETSESEVVIIVETGRREHPMFLQDSRLRSGGSLPRSAPRGGTQ